MVIELQVSCLYLLLSQTNSFLNLSSSSGGVCRKNSTSFIFCEKKSLENVFENSFSIIEKLPAVREYYNVVSRKIPFLGVAIVEVSLPELDV